MNNVIQFPRKKEVRMPLSSVQGNLNAEFMKVPIIQQALFILRQASNKGIKLTEKENLNRKCVQEFWDQLIKLGDGRPEWKPSKEDDCPEAVRIRFLLTESGYLRKYKKHLVLTKKAEEALREQMLAPLYADLFNTGLSVWAWEYMDGYPEYDFIQDAAPYLIYFIKQREEPTINSMQLFTGVFGEIELPEEDPHTPVFSVAEEMVRCLGIRFIERFALPFGLLEQEGEEPLDWFCDIKTLYKKTLFFEDYFVKLFAFESTL